ncbi:MAG TPA: head-tail adaptor protein [Alcaligenes faecalis]|nr:head-tail adaptor protein [Alcaligenes faecalis]
MQAGRLRHRLSIQENRPGRDPDTGAVIPVWVELTAVRGSFEPLSARDFIAAAAAQTKLSARAVVRYRADIKEKMRLVHSGKVFLIQGALPDKESGREYLTLLLSEDLSDG